MATEWVSSGILSPPTESPSAATRVHLHLEERHKTNTQTRPPLHSALSLLWPRNLWAMSSVERQKDPPDQRTCFRYKSLQVRATSKEISPQTQVSSAGFPLCTHKRTYINLISTQIRHPKVPWVFWVIYVEAQEVLIFYPSVSRVDGK